MADHNDEYSASNNTENISDCEFNDDYGRSCDNDHIDNLNIFLNDRRVNRKKDATHFALQENGDKYYISHADYDEFIKHYSDVVINHPDAELSLVEKVSDTGVSYLLINFDFVHRKSERRYNEKMIKKLIKIINGIIIESFVVVNHELKCYITEKSTPCAKSNNLYKDGFHIYYPYLALTMASRYYVLDTLRNVLETEYSTLLAPIKCVNPLNDVIGVSIVTDYGIMMMGSSKPGKSKYVLTRAYDMNLDNIEIPEISEQISIFSNSQYCIDSPVEVRNTKISKLITRVCNQYKIVDTHKKTLSDIDAYVNDDSDSVSDEEFYSDEESENIVKDTAYYCKLKKRLSPAKKREVDLAERLTKIYRTKRASRFKDWRRVGYALYAVDECLYPTFVAFTKKASKQRGNKQNKTPADIWKEAESYSEIYSIDTLRQWARIDNNKKYEDILRIVFKDEFEKAKSCTHVDLATLIHCLYRDRFVCININKNKWYEFQDHRYVLVQSAYTLENIISSDVRDMLLTFLENDLEKLRGSNYDKDKYKAITKIMDNVGKLADVKFRSNVVRACANKFYDVGFEGKLDTDAYLVGFENGVFDLRELAFRDGMPSDNVSKSTGYDYVDCKRDDPIFNTILKFFAQVHTDPDMMDYVLMFMASIFRGIPDQHVHIWTGVGGNGKSITVDIIKNLLGEYFGILPVTFLTTKKKSSSGPTPELADKAGKRFLAIQEPEHNDTVYVGQMKEISGTDTLYAHAKFGDPFEYKPMFKIVLTCNNLPHIPSDDIGTWRRLRVTPWESRFVDNPKGPKQFAKDGELNQKIKAWTQPLAWYLLNVCYPKYMKGVKGTSYKIKEPALVTKYTNNYKADSDFYLDFINEQLEITNDREDCETISFIYGMFKNWYKSGFDNKAPSRKEFISYLERHKYKCDKKNIYGLRCPIA